MKIQYILTLTLVVTGVLILPAHAADLDLLSSATSLQAGSRDLPRADAAQARSVAAWKLSLAPVAAAEFLDAYSSRGMRELNPVLAGPGGQFGAKAELLKAGIAGALVGMEYLVVHKHPAAAKVFWKINLISAGVTGGVAAHNFSLR